MMGSASSKFLVRRFIPLQTNVQPGASLDMFQGNLHSFYNGIYLMASLGSFCFSRVKHDAMFDLSIHCGQLLHYAPSA